MISTASVSRQLYEILYQWCSPYSLATPWSLLAVDGDVRACAAEGDALLSALAGSFSPADLVHAGIACNNTETLTLHPALAAPAKPLVFLRPTKTACPIEVLTPLGTLSGRHLPLTAALSDHHVRKALERWGGDLLVAFALEEVVLLRSLGLPATLATGLDDVSPRQLCKLCRSFGWKKHAPQAEPPEAPWAEPARPEPARAAPEAPSLPEKENALGPKGEKPVHPSSSPAPSPTLTKARLRQAYNKWIASLEHQAPLPADFPTLTLLGWSPSQLLLHMPADLHAVQTHMRNLHKHLGIQRMEVGLWFATAAYVERLTFQAQHLHFGTLAAEMATEIEATNGDALWLSLDAGPAVAPPANYQQAHQELRQAIQASRQAKCRPERLEQAQQAFEEQLEQELILPLHKSTAAPHLRNLQATQMAASRIFHRMGAVLEEQLTRTSLEQLVRSPDAVPLPALKQWLQIVQTMIALNKELRS